MSDLFTTVSVLDDPQARSLLDLLIMGVNRPLCGGDKAARVEVGGQSQDRDLGRRGVWLKQLPAPKRVFENSVAHEKRADPVIVKLRNSKRLDDVVRHCSFPRVMHAGDADTLSGTCKRNRFCSAMRAGTRVSA